MTNSVSFIVYMLITAFTPGPNNITSMTNASTYGFKKSWSYNLGMWCAFSVVMILCALFTTVLQIYIPSIKPYLLGAGAAYMLHLAWKTWRSEPPKETPDEELLDEDINRKEISEDRTDEKRIDETDITTGEKKKTKKKMSLFWQLFLSGAVLQFVNPKIMIYGITSLSVYIVPVYSDKVIIALFALLLSSVGTTSTVCWALAGSVLRTLFAKHTKVVNTILALLLLWCTISLFL